jgi:hypothetical protein
VARASPPRFVPCASSGICLSGTQLIELESTEPANVFMSHPKKARLSWILVLEILASMAFFLRILARGRLGIGPAGHTVEYEQDYGKRVTHWVHLDELGIRQGQNAQLNALTLLRSGSVAAYQNGFDRSLRFAWRAGARAGAGKRRAHFATAFS